MVTDGGTPEYITPDLTGFASTSSINHCTGQQIQMLVHSQPRQHHHQHHHL
jgi:hypothetical protein